MQTDAGFPAALERARRACAAAVARLDAAEAPTEALAEFVPPRRALFVFTRPATMRPLGNVWRVGALLLGTDRRLYGVGRVTRAAERGRPGYQSLSREERRDLAAAALRGGYPEGSPVHFDAVPIMLDAVGPTGEPLPADPLPDSPVGFSDGEMRVRWRAGAPLAGAPTLEAYLAERVELLTNPPQGAT